MSKASKGIRRLLRDLDVLDYHVREMAKAESPSEKERQLYNFILGFGNIKKILVKIIRLHAGGDDVAERFHRQCVDHEVIGYVLQARNMKEHSEDYDFDEIVDSEDAAVIVGEVLRASNAENIRFINCRIQGYDVFDLSITTQGHGVHDIKGDVGIVRTTPPRFSLKDVRDKRGKSFQVPKMFLDSNRPELELARYSIDWIWPHIKGVRDNLQARGLLGPSAGS